MRGMRESCCAFIRAVNNAKLILGTWLSGYIMFSPVFDLSSHSAKSVQQFRVSMLDETNSCYLTFFDVVGFRVPKVVVLAKKAYRIGFATDCDIVLPWEAEYFNPGGGSVVVRKSEPNKLLSECWKVYSVPGESAVNAGAGDHHHQHDGDSKTAPCVYRGGRRALPLDLSSPNACSQPFVLYHGDVVEIYFSSMFQGGEVCRFSFTDPKLAFRPPPPPPVLTPGTKPPPNWLSLPDKVWLEIFSHVPPGDVLSSVSGVCTRFWSLVKAGIPFRKLTLGVGKGAHDAVHCLRDVRWLCRTSSHRVAQLHLRRCDAAAGSLSGLRCYDYAPTDKWIYYSTYWRFLFEEAWPDLRVLTFKDDRLFRFDVMVPEAVDEGGKLVNLRSLKIVCQDEMNWSHFEDVEFRNLEELVVAPARNTLAWFDGEQFFKVQFPKLRTMACSLPLQHLELFSNLPDNSSSVGSTTKVECLMLSNFLEADQVFEESEDGPWEPLFFDAVKAGKFDGLSSLLLELKDWDHPRIRDVCFANVEELCLVTDEFMAGEPVAAADVFRCFPKLRSLVLGEGIGLDWDACCRASFSRLVCLGISVDSRSSKRIPWDELSSLEFLAIYGRHANPARIVASVMRGAENLRWLQVGEFQQECAANDTFDSCVSDEGDEMPMTEVAKMVSLSKVEYFDYTPDGEDHEPSYREARKLLSSLLAGSANLRVVVVRDFDLLLDGDGDGDNDDDDEVSEPSAALGLSRNGSVTSVGRELAADVCSFAGNALELVRYGRATLYCPSGNDRCDELVAFPPGRFAPYLKFAQTRRAADLFELS